MYFNLNCTEFRKILCCATKDYTFDADSLRLRKSPRPRPLEPSLLQCSHISLRKDVVAQTILAQL
jgi:hypothetical protein